MQWIYGLVRELGWKDLKFIICTDQSAACIEALRERSNQTTVLIDLQDRGHVDPDATPRGEHPDVPIHLVLTGVCESVGGHHGWSDPECDGDTLATAVERCADSIRRVSSAFPVDVALTVFVPAFARPIAEDLAGALHHRLIMAPDVGKADPRPFSNNGHPPTDVPAPNVAFPTRPFRWHVGTTEIQIRFDDLFKVDATVKVSSEQTDFVLSLDPTTISGRLGRIGGEKLRRLCAQKVTEAAAGLGVAPDALPVPTVIETEEKRTGRWFHAGIHAPVQQTALGEPAEDLKAIESAIDEILRRVSRTQHGVRLDSIAIPLLGTGTYGVAPRLSAAVILRTLVVAVLREPSPPRRIILVLPPDERGLDAFETAVQTMLDGRADSAAIPWTQPLNLHLTLTSGLEQRILRAADPGYRAWLYCCLSEQVVAYMHAISAAQLVRLAIPAPPPEGHWVASFGTVKRMLFESLSRLPLESHVTDDPLGHWVDHIARVCHEQRKAFDRLITLRNDVAHRALEASEPEAKDLLQRVTGRGRWADLARSVPPPQTGLEPWVAGSPASRILSVVNHGQFRYVETSTGLPE